MIKIFTIGNTLMKDDGISFHIIRKIKEDLYALNKDIQIFFGEMDYMYCLYKIEKNDVVIIVDGVIEGNTIGKVERKNIEQFQYLRFDKQNLSLIDLIKMNEEKIKVHLVTIEVFDIEYGNELSSEIKKRFKQICNAVYQEIVQVIKEEEKYNV